MRYHGRPLRPQREEGSVAVEAALVISLILVPLLAFIMLFGRYFWYYTMAQKAAHDATLIMATSPLADVRSFAASGLAASAINRGIADMDAKTRSTLGITTECWFRFPANAPFLQPFACNFASVTPALVRTTVAVSVTDPFLAPIINQTLGDGILQIGTQSSVRYVGR